MSDTVQADTVQAPDAPKKGAPARGRKRTLVGHVVSAKMQKTVVVEVARRVLHPMFKKFVRHREKYKVHDEKGCRPGDLVEIQEHRPMSREKRFVVARIVRRQEEA